MFSKGYGEYQLLLQVIGWKLWIEYVGIGVFYVFFIMWRGLFELGVIGYIKDFIFSKEFYCYFFILLDKYANGYVDRGRIM